MLRLLTIICCLAASGCISHEARVVPPVGDPCTAVVGTQVIEHFVEPVSEQHSLPRSIPVTAWRLDRDGRMERGDALIETPLPWWQRFPIDAVSDMVVPGTMTTTTTGTVTLQPVPATNPVDLAARARAAGYAAPVEARHP